MNRGPMTTRLIKETRDLLPAFVIALLVIVVPFAIWGEHLEGFVGFALALGCAIMGAGSFGHELQHRTMPLLLSQPIPRAELWREKMLVLAAGMLGAYAVAWGCLKCFPLTPGELSGPQGRWVLLLVALCVFCGAPLFTLATRNGIAGVVSSICAPAFLLCVAALITERWFGHTNEEVVLVLAGFYCLVTCWLGLAAFKRFEVIEGTSRELRLPSRVEAFLAAPLGRTSATPAGPLAGLLRKELRLQHTSFLLAGIFCLIALSAVCLRIVSPAVGDGVLAADFTIYLILLPLIAAGMSVAEERTWGVAEWHLTLPPSALRQWFAKMAVTLPLSLLLGLVLPMALFLAGALLLGARDASVPGMLQLLTWVAAHLCITSLAVYASTLCAATLRAVLASFGLIVGLGCWVYSVVQANPATWLPWAGFITQDAGFALKEGCMWSFACLAFLVVLGLAQWFAFSNFRQRGIAPARYLVQITSLLFITGLFVVLLATL